MGMYHTHLHPPITAITDQLEDSELELLEEWSVFGRHFGHVLPVRSDVIMG